MIWETIQGVSVPFVGTALGAACVFFLKNGMNETLQRALRGFAAGVMVAASIWSLLIPAVERSEGLGRWSFLPAVVGFWAGILFLLLLDRLIPPLREDSVTPAKNSMLVLAVTIHNLPEGMAVGAIYAGYLAGDSGVTALGAFSLALGIAIQNFPEGAIVSLPLRAEGAKKGRAFWYGVGSGAVEPLGAALTILAARLVVPILPYLLSFAAGAMIYVVVEELIPEMFEGERTSTGTVLFAVGFTLMMALDVALG